MLHRTKISIQGQLVTTCLGFEKPYGLTLDNGKILVCDLGLNTVFRLSLDLEPEAVLQSKDQTFEWSPCPSNHQKIDSSELSGPHSICKLSSGATIIANYFGKNLICFDETGKITHKICNKTFDISLEGVASVSEAPNHTIWLVDFDGHKLVNINSEYKIIQQIGEFEVIDKKKNARRTKKKGGFDNPHMISFINDGTFVVVETGNNRLQCFTKNKDLEGYKSEEQGNTLKTLHGLESKFNKPVSVHYVEDGYLIVADNGNDRILKISTTGRPTKIFSFQERTGKFNWSDSNINACCASAFFKRPFHAIETHNSLYVADGWNSRILKFENLLKDD